MIVRLVAALLVGWLCAAVYVFVLRDGDRPVRSDAVVVLSGADERLPVGVRLAAQGVAPLLVVSRSHDPKPYELRVCARRSGVLCFSSHPYSTQGEAREIGRLARTRHWTRVTVVTSRFHAFRAKWMIERCYDGPLRVVAAPNPDLPSLVQNFAAETVKIVYHGVVSRGC